MKLELLAPTERYRGRGPHIAGGLTCNLHIPRLQPRPRDDVDHH